MQAQTVVEQHGRLRVVGNQVVDKNNQTISLAGAGTTNTAHLGTLPASLDYEE